MKHKPKCFKINSLLIEFAQIISSCLVMYGLRCPVLFLHDTHYEIETSWGREGSMNVPQSGNKVPSALYKHLLYDVVIDMLFTSLAFL